MGPRRVSHVLALSAALAAAGALGRPVALAAQSATPAAWQATPASVLKGALRAAAAAQARYREAKGTYAASVDPLALRLEPGVRVEIFRAGRTGWQGKATYLTQPGRSCVVFVGALDGAEAPRTDGDREMAGENGIPLCDRMR
jgi:hypothetical protein